MRNIAGIPTSCFCLALLCIPLAVSLTWHHYLSWFSTPTSTSDNGSGRTRNRNHISHLAASDPDQDIIPENIAWYETDGTPLFYSAWRARPGQLSPEPNARSSLMRHGARVACWPSTGGVWIKHADVVDMEFLGLDRFKNTPRQFCQIDEDDFCTNLKMLGASWWALPPNLAQRELLGIEQYDCDTLETCYVADTQNRYLLAWPETRASVCYISIAQAEEGGELLGGYRNTMNMEERCDVIISLGGKEYFCRKECPELDYRGWSFRDPGDGGCDDAPLYMDQDLLDSKFDPKPTVEVLQWANRFCERNGWKKQ